MVQNPVYFGQLLRYKPNKAPDKGIDFYKKTPIIKFDTIYEKAEWKVFAIYFIDADIDVDTFFEFRTREFETQDEFMNFIERSKRRSLINTTVDVKPDDRIITLCTCTYEAPKKKLDLRFIVMARKVRVGESSNVDVLKAEINPNPLYPPKWYSYFKMTKPKFEGEPGFE